MNIEIKYDGRFPNLCSGHLIVIIDDIPWDFGEYCLVSGGHICRNEEWDMWAESGPWEVSDWPKNFPEDLKESVLATINEEIPWGCCGGCI